MKKQLSEDGQSTIEFIFTFSFAVTLIFLIFNSAMNYTSGYIVHYANFMASRTYLTYEKYTGNYGQSDLVISDGVQAATEVFNKYNLQVFNLKNLEFKVNTPDGDNSHYLTVGTYVLFEQKIDPMARITGQKILEKVSESFLGKEPSRVECATRTCKSMTGKETCDEGSYDITLFDNGC